MKKYSKQPVIMKLSPNVTSIAEMAKAVEAGGADAVSLINTITGMRRSISTGRALCWLIRLAASPDGDPSDRSAHGL